MPKSEATKTEESSDYSELASKVKDSAHLIWLAGLGAYMKAGKEGVKLFDNLVQEGKELDEFTREKASEITETASSELKKIEDSFDSRVSQTLSRIGLASKNQDKEELKALSEQIAELSKAIESLKKKK